MVTGSLIVAGVPVSMVIMTLVEVAKRAGMPSRLAPLCAMGLGVLVSVAVEAAAVVPFLGQWWGAVGGGVMLGLTACGLYSGAKSMIVRRGGTVAGQYQELPSGDVVDSTVTPLPSAPGGGGTPPMVGPGGTLR